MSPVLRRVLALLGLGLGGAALAAAGCSATLGLDDYQSAGQSLCDLLGSCSARIDSAECGLHVDAALVGLPPTRQTKWLSELGDRKCLDTCNSARACLGRTPICVGHRGLCHSKEECCGFVEGTSDCDARSARCCFRQGVRCKGDEDCCPGAGACDPSTGTCGGVVCKLAGTSCFNGFECCSGVCDAKTGACTASTCLDDGFDCAADADCCSQTCDPSSGKCQAASCNVEGTACDPHAASPCCTGLTCFVADAAPDQPGVCSKQACFPDQFDCAVDDQCCSKYCNRKFHLCSKQCVALGSTCASTVECCDGSCDDDGTGKKVCRACSLDVCTTDGDCCHGTCKTGGVGVAGLCAETCKGTCSHDVCSAGAPLDGSCPTDAACIAAVCAIDAYCCCVGWDDLCRNAVGAAPACNRDCFQ
jgi:hypothetical protein